MNNFVQSIKNLSPGRLASIIAIIIFLVGFFVYIASQLGSKDYAVLYTDLELEDAKQIVTKLDSSGIKYRLTKNGTEIQVPSEVVNKMRVDTAELALSSKGANVGYEIFDKADALGSTNFVQNVNLIRALEGELARTIRSVDNIKSARVHLVLPKREMFSREELAPSASVIIKTLSGKLNLQSVHAIQKLIAAAVPKLDVKNVAIVDSSGNLLTDNYQDGDIISNATNEAIRQEQERKIAGKVQALLERTIGEGKVRAQVNLEMDFDQVITNEEIFDPDGQVVRSSATVNEEANNSAMEGPVSVSQNIPNPDSLLTGAAGNGSQNSRTEETINYEISKTVRNKVKSTGTISRLSIAVMIDGFYDKDENGNEVYRERTPQEMARIASIVKSVVGFDEDRGDNVEVVNMRFVRTALEEAMIEKSLILGFNKEDLIRMAEGLGVAIVAILVILLVIRPLINNAFDVSGSSEGQLLGEGAEDEGLLLSNFLGDDDADLDELISMQKVDGRVKMSSLKKINDIVEKNPETAVNIIRSWLYQSDNS